MLYHHVVCSFLGKSDLYLQVLPCSALCSRDQPHALFQDRNSRREAVNQLDVHLPVCICEGELFVPLWCGGARRGESHSFALCLAPSWNSARVTLHFRVGNVTAGLFAGDRDA